MNVESLRKVFGLKEIQYANNDKKQQEKFLGKCKACGSVMRWIEGTNVLVCSNPSCKGIKNKNRIETEEAVYSPSFRFASSRVAESLFT